VDLTKNTNGASSVSFSEAHWKEEFLGRYGLAFGASVSSRNTKYVVVHTMGVISMGEISLHLCKSRKL
jgi:hypothetical protein